MIDLKLGIIKSPSGVPFKSDLDFYAKSREDLTLVDTVSGSNASVVGREVGNVTTTSTLTIAKTTGQNLYPLNANMYAKREDAQAVIRSAVNQSISKLEIAELGYVIWFDSSLGTTLSFSIGGLAGQTNKVYWGDGTYTNVSYVTNDVGITVSHTYTASSGMYYVILDNSNYTFISINTQNLKGNVTNFNTSYCLYLYSLPLLTGVVTNFNPSYYLYLYNLPLLTGVVTNFNPSNYLRLYNLPLLTGDASNFNPSNTLYLYNIPNITINSQMIFQYALKSIYFISCGLDQTEVGRIVQRAYDNGNTAGTMNITGNATPSAATLTQINTMVTSRGWTITYS
jgi:hypothetical protein